MSTVSFNCEAITDPDELINLKLGWLYNGQPLDGSDRDNRVAVITLSARRSRLQISGVRRDDAGVYLCSASNGLDSVQSQPAQLLVKGDFVWRLLNCHRNCVSLFRVTHVTDITRLLLITSDVLGTCTCTVSTCYITFINHPLCSIW